MMLCDEFYLLPPHRLPLSPSEILKSKHVTQLKQLAIISSTSTDPFIYKEIQRMLTVFEPSVKAFKPLFEDNLESKENKDNDVAFKIIRVEGNVMDILCHSSIKAFLGILSDVMLQGTSLSAHEWGVIHHAYSVIYHLYSAPNTRIDCLSIDKLPLVSIADVDMSGDDAHQRWVHGHYVFMTFTQAMVVSLNFFQQAIHEHEYDDASNYLNVATCLMQASEVALKYAGDFSDKAYTDGVRPTLMPPVAQPKMSGLYWRDHEFLIKKNFKKLNPIFINPPSVIQASVSHFKQALNKTYDAHRYVCSQFVGKEEPSLLSSKPAVETLENFKKSRLKLLFQERKHD